MVCLEKARKEQGFSYRDTESIDATRHGMVRGGDEVFRRLPSLRFVSERYRRDHVMLGPAFLESLALTVLHVSHPFRLPLAITSHTFALSHATRSA